LVIDLANLGLSGFRIDGIDADDVSGRSVFGAGDVLLFDRLEIRETTTANENEFFGTVSPGGLPPILFQDDFESLPFR
jgi:hypothetical protein